MSTIILTSVVASAVVAAGLTAAVIPLLRAAQVLDVPVGRSLHRVPVPRGGGLGVVLAVALTVWVPAALLAQADRLPQVVAHLDVVLLGVVTVLALTVVGLVEDLFALPARVRLAAQLVVGAGLGTGAAWQAGASPWWAVAVAACTCGIVNVTNFMDGANGLAAGHGVVAAAWYTAVSLVWPVPGLGQVMVVLAGACLGFLPFNAPRARVFLGDCGSYGLGAAWAFAATVCLAHGVPALVAVAPLLVLVADAGYTLWMRVRAGQRWYEPHKLHVYQRLVSAGWPHWGVAVLVAGASALCCAAALPVLVAGAWGPVATLAALVVLAAYLRLPVAVGAPNPFRTAGGGR